MFSYMHLASSQLTKSFLRTGEYTRKVRIKMRIATIHIHCFDGSANFLFVNFLFLFVMSDMASFNHFSVWNAFLIGMKIEF